MRMVGNELLANNPLWVVDVGASGGIDPKWAKFTSAYRGILFEPDPREYEILKSRAGKNLIVLNSALSDSVNAVDFNLCRAQKVSSVYLPNHAFLSKFPDPEDYQVMKTIRIKTDTLDNQLKANGIAEIDFMKIDTQGTELPILKGSVDYLYNAIGLEIEVEFAQLYKHQPLFNEVDTFVRENDFELFDIKRHFWKRNGSINTCGQKGQLVCGDALYFKTPEQVVLMKNITQEKIIRSICAYLVYGYLDLAQALFNNANSKGLLAKEAHDKVVLILSKYEKRNTLPNFRGKWRIERLFEKIGNVFSHSEWYSGTDKSVGNP